MRVACLNFSQRYATFLSVSHEARDKNSLLEKKLSFHTRKRFAFKSRRNLNVAAWLSVHVCCRRLSIMVVRAAEVSMCVAVQRMLTCPSFSCHRRHLVVMMSLAVACGVEACRLAVVGIMWIVSKIVDVMTIRVNVEIAVGCRPALRVRILHFPSPVFFPISMHCNWWTIWPPAFWTSTGFSCMLTVEYC